LASDENRGAPSLPEPELDPEEPLAEPIDAAIPAMELEADTDIMLSLPDDDDDDEDEPEPEPHCSG